MKTIPKAAFARFAERCGKRADELAFFSGGQDWSDGTLFRYDSEGRAMVLKILDMRAEDGEGRERAADRVRFVSYFGESGCSIVLPMPFPGDTLFAEESEGEKSYLAYRYGFVPGRTVEKNDKSPYTGNFYRAVGSLLGRLHAAWEKRPESLTLEGTSDASRFLKGWRDEMASFRDWCKDDEVRGAWDNLRIALSKLPVDKAGYGFVHNDAHAFNMLFDPDAEPGRSGGEPRLTLLDFDVANYHWFMNDSAIALYSFFIMSTGGIETLQEPPAGFRDFAFSAFWEGYRRHRDPGALWVEKIDLFLQYRRCLMFMPFQEETAKKPAWRSLWKSRILAEDKRLFG
jgi:Ser/Thr protein kinase RdoA (MazF antagonist)